MLRRNKARRQPQPWQDAPPPPYTPAMAEPPDLAELARRYVELWQEQLSALAADPAAARGMAGLLAGMAPFWPKQEGAAHDAPPAPEPNRPPAAGAASGEFGPDLARLASRLAAVEKRLAALEGGARPGGGQPRARPRRRKR